MKLRAEAAPFMPETVVADGHGDASLEISPSYQAHRMPAVGLFCPYCISGEQCAFHPSTSLSWTNIPDQLCGRSSCRAKMQAGKHHSRMLPQVPTGSPPQPPPSPPAGLQKENEAEVLISDGGFCPWCRLGGCPIHGQPVLHKVPETSGPLELDDVSTDLADSDSSETETLLYGHANPCLA